MSEIARPELTFPEAEAARLRAAYEAASAILEYGSGGSTVMAAEMEAKRIFSVESDRDWAQMMRGWFAANPPARDSAVEIIWSDIGATKEWGYPKTNDEYLRFARYPLEVWQLPEFVQPQVVLVDGRFRAGCAMATALSTREPLTLFVDDYKRRTQYHRIEQWLGPAKLTGRMAEFEVQPMDCAATDLLTIIEMMLKP